MKRFSKFIQESVELDEKLKSSDDMGDWVKDFQDSDAPQFKGKSQKKRQQMAIAAKLDAERNEEVELDEVSASTLRSYVDKARADKSRQQKARTVAKNDYKKYGIPSDKERADAAHSKASQRNTGISMAKRKLGGYTKGTQPKVLAREEVELDEAVKIGSKVRIHAPGKDYHGKVGHVGEIRRGAFAKAPPSYTIDYREPGEDRNRSVMLSKEKIKLHKESVELDEERKLKFAISKNAKTNGYGIAQWTNYTWWYHSDNTKKYFKTSADAKKYIENVWGKGHTIEINESVELDEVSKDTLGRYAAKALNRGDMANRMSKSDDDGMGKIASKRLAGVKKAVDKLADKTGKKALARSIKKDVDTAKASGNSFARGGGVDDQGKSYYKAVRNIGKMREEVEIDQETQYEIVESYLLENNIDIHSLSEEELNELIGKAIGGAFKLGAKAAVGAARLAKRAVVNKQGNIRGTQAARDDKAGDRAEKEAKKREAEYNRRKRIQAAEKRAGDLDDKIRKMKSGSTA